MDLDLCALREGLNETIFPLPWTKRVSIPSPPGDFAVGEELAGLLSFEGRVKDRWILGWCSGVEGAVEVAIIISYH